MKYKVFIDTCIYKSMRYKFSDTNSLSMDLLKSQIDMNKIEILMPIIVKNEIISHLNPDKELIETNIKNAIKDATKEYPWIIDNNNEIRIKSFFNNQIIKDFEKFLKTYKCKILSYSYIDIEKVFDKYFKGKYPFEKNNKKKSEFPDACSIDIIKNYLKNDLKNLIVITTDEGVKKSFPKNVQVFPSINALLKFLNSEIECSNDISLHLKRIEVTKEEEILKLIRKDADNIKLELINIPKINKNKFDNIFINNIRSFDLIGKKDSHIYLSLKVSVFAELYIDTYQINQDGENGFVDKIYEYIDETTYNAEIKINGIDNYEIIKVSNTLNQNTIYVDESKIISILFPIDDNL